MKQNLPGGSSAVVPPDPMPNSEVKRRSADGSVGSPHVRVGNCQTSNKTKGPVERSGLLFYLLSAVEPLSEGRTNSQGVAKQRPGGAGKGVRYNQIKQNAQSKDRASCPFLCCRPASDGVRHREAKGHPDGWPFYILVNVLPVIKTHVYVLI